MAQLAPADVHKLKCIFFQNVRDIVEIDWYGIKCNIEDKLEIINTAKAYLSIYDQCFEDYKVQCLIENFIKKHYNVCELTLIPCEDRESIGINIA